MFCKFCGCEIAHGAQFCTGCGKELNWTASYESAVEADSLTKGFNDTFSSKKFGAATVLLTVATALSFLATLITGNITIPIIEIFAIIAFWKLKAAAEKGSPIQAFGSPFKTLRILTVIERVIMWVLVGVFGVCGVLMVVVGSSFDSEFAATFIEGFNDGMVSAYGLDGLFESITDNLFLFMIILGAIFVIVAAVIAVFAATMYTTFVKCAKSYEETAFSGVNVVIKQSNARGWLITMAVFTILSAVGTMTDISGIAGLMSFAGEVCNIVFLFMLANILKENNLQ